MNQQEPSIESPPSPPSILRRLIEKDISLSLRIHTLCQPVPRWLLKTLEISGDGRFWFPVPIALLFSPLPSSSAQARSILIGLLIGSLLDLALVGSIKHLIRRPRPVYNKGMHLTFAVDHWSFPSGHSSRVFFIAAFLYLSLVYGDGGDLRPSSFLGMVFVWSAVTSVSRVLLGRHFALDVIAGAALGVFEGLVVYRFLKKI
ncbi:hypothetical protein QJS10_CPA01g02725 [Acorus calamus]|uniref:Phosphatidic acid phosphatase type 2/haloperoxidase domain-containing protein n=1 Tax=Acorus calamus TaxID=4465 RepID=A0AAV9FMZ0_ACOCL|nr:hypothetical protein QJS10_CPA01g02725 [Acorus calamus]